MQNFIGNRVLGSVKRTQEIQLGQVLSKKVGTIDYDFPGAAYYVGSFRTGSGGTGNEVGVVPKNTIYFRQTTSPYKYQPLILMKIKTVGTAPHSDFVVEGTDAYALGYGRGTNTGEDWYLQLWDVSQAKWSDFASDSTNVTATNTITTTTSLANPAVSDFLAIGKGAADFRNWVIFDEEVNLRSDAKPAAIGADVIASLIYDGRINGAAITQWRDMPASMKTEFQKQCGRLFADTL